MALSWTLDKLGPMARSAEDASLVLAAIAGPDGDDPSSLAGTYRHPARSRRHSRVGVLTEDWKNGDPRIQAAWERAVKDFEKAGCDVRDARLPDEPWSLVAATIVVAEGSASFENVARGPRIARLSDVSQRAGLAAGLAVSAADYLHALRLRPRLDAAMQRVFSDFDVLVAPSLTKVAPPVEANLDKWFAGSGTLQAAGNAVGIPCVSVPMGFGEGGLPCGLQVAAPWGREADAVSVARSYQAVTRWHTMRPKGFGV
jgi:aspartyl-tRNA(Asn)/glutamyl-tRNA(Gln) amidotransferase subunit A